MPKMKEWVAAARLRTLPLAFASILLGSFLAASQGSFDWAVFILSLLTTLFYQVLSNFANDYGDGTKGTDANRKGEARAVASGVISAERMRSAMRLFIFLSLLSGTSLSFWACRDLGLEFQLGFTALGILATWSAVNYTVGDSAYGYKGLGDLFVLLFFGFAGVGGSYFLHQQEWNWLVLLPGTSLGFFAMAVLNLNNMRDRETDSISGKQTLALSLGVQGSKAYHTLLLILGFDAAFLYNRLMPSSIWQNLYFISLPFLILNLVAVLKAKKPEDYEPLLKKMALTTLLFAVLFGFGKVL